MTDRQGQDINNNLFLILVHKPLTPPPFDISFPTIEPYVIPVKIRRATEAHWVIIGRL